MDPAILQPEHADTRQRLLDAAGAIFARDGFHHATVRDICQRAASNIAAVNYHFGSKQELYRAVLAEAKHAAMKSQSLTAIRSSDPPAAQLRAFIRQFVFRLLDEGRPAWHGTLMAREMVEPSDALDEVAREFVRPQYLHLCGLVRTLLGGTPDEDLVRRVACSIAGQCLFYKHCRPMIERAMPEVAIDAGARAAIADHIADFSLAAIERLNTAAGTGVTRSPVGADATPGVTA